MSETHLKIKLLSHTPSGEEIIALAGRICYSSCGIDELEARSEGTSIISRLLSMGHESPLEHLTFTFGVEGVSRALLAQLTRHRIASFSVQSQRYVLSGSDFSYIVPDSIKALGDEALTRYHEQMRTIGGFYDEWRDAGLPAEDARFVLPNAAETKLVMSMNARELLHFFSLRCCGRAQWEIQAMAWEMLRLCVKVAPTVFKDAGPACLRGACPEGKKSCGRSAEMRERSKALQAR